MACGAISESSPVRKAEALVARRAREAPVGFAGLSEKQYQAPAGLARNCRFFSISLAALNRARSPLLGGAERSHQRNRVSFFRGARPSGRRPRGRARISCEA